MTDDHKLSEAEIEAVQRDRFLADPAVPADQYPRLWNISAGMVYERVIRAYSTATGVLELTLYLHAPLTARFIPTTASGTGQPIAGRGAAARQAAARYATLRACAERAPQPSLRPGRTPGLGQLAPPRILRPACHNVAVSLPS